MIFFRHMHNKLDFIIQLLHDQATQGTRIMAAIDDFNAAMDKLGASIDTLGTEITALIAAHNSGSDAAFAAAAARLQTLQTKLDADVTAAAATPPVAPTP